MRSEVDILIDDDDIKSDDYVIHIPEVDRELMLEEFERMVSERKSDLEKMKRERGSILFDPENLDLEASKDG